MLRGCLHRRGFSVTLPALLQGTLVLIFGALFAGNATAATPAGTHILNSGSVNFSEGANLYSATSNQTDVTVTNNVVAGATLASPHTGYVQAGKWVSYSHTATNTGTAADTLDLTAVSSLGLTIEFLASDGTTPLTDTDADGKVDTGSLAAGGSFSFVVKLSAPISLEPDQIDQTTITAASSINPAVTASAVDTSTILKDKFWDPLIKTADPPGQITADTVLTYTNIFGNAGNIPATNVVITDVLDANLIYIDGSATEPPGISGTVIVYNPIARTVTWTIPSMPAGYTGQISFRARINPAIPSDTAIGNTINMVSDQTPIAELSNAVSSMIVEQPLRITKVAGKKEAEIGDYVGYTVTVENTSTTMTVSNVTITDRLPHGFRYINGSSRLDGADYGDPTRSSNPAWNIGSMAPGTSKTMTYSTLISIDAPLGNGVNSASAAGRSPGGNPVSAGPVTAAVKVKDGVLNDKAIILGRVFEDTNRDRMPDEDEPGIKGARIYIEDGTYVITDDEGKFSIFGVEAGEHILKLDKSSIPAGYKTEPLDNAFAGDGGSRFVSAPFGGPARGDFAVVPSDKPAAPALEKPGEKKGSLTFGTSSNGMNPAPAPLEKQIETMEATTEILEPANGTLLGKNWGDVVVRIPEGSSYTLKINGAVQSAADSVGTIIHESERGIFIHKYVGVKFSPGRNSITVTTVEPSGRQVTKEIEVTVPGPPEKIVITPDKTDIPADGITEVLVTVALLDQMGNRSPGEQIVTVTTSMGVIGNPDLDPSMAGHQLKTKNGMVRFRLRSSGKTGSDQIKVRLGSALEQTTDIYFVPALRDWIVAGIGEMKFGNRDISGNVSKITKHDDFDKGSYHDERLAFFAKGRLLEKYQLTAAYDSQKDKRDELFQKTEPNKYYPIYGDSSTIGYDAESQEKLYLKLERDRSYAMFGDYKTELSNNEFSRYDRTFNGLKTNIDTKYFSFRGFGAYTSQSVTKDELSGNGTSGFYFLSKSPIIENSEKVRIEVRDRYHPELVISTMDKARNTDYQINYTTGTVLFKEPVPSLDENLNPVRIVVTYESDDPGDRYYIYGGRAAVKLGTAAEVGLTGIVEEKAIKDTTLVGADAVVRIGEKAQVKAEVAVSESLDKGKDEAWKVEASAEPVKDMKVTAHYRDVGENFQNPSMSGTEAGTKKYGGKVDYRITEKTQIVAERFTQENRVSDSTLTSSEISLRQKIYSFLANAGYKHLTEDQGANADTTSRIIMAGVGGNITDNLGFQVNREQVISSGEIRDYQTKTGLRLDYKLTEKTKAYVAQEFQQGKDNERNATLFGLENRITDNTTVTTKYEMENAVSGERGQASIGLNNKWEVMKGLTLNTRAERIQVVKGASNGADNMAFSVGAEYLPDKEVKVTGRYEARLGDSERTSLYNVGVVIKLNRELSVLAKMNLWESRKDAGTDTTFDGLVGIALRTMGNRSVYLLSTLRHKYERSGSTTGDTAGSYITSTEASWRVTPKLTVLGKYAGKYSRDNMNSGRFSSYTDMLLAGVRFDITDRWDVEVSARLMNQYKLKMYSVGSVIKTGYRVYKNLYFDVGYNFSKLTDRDLSGESYDAKGFFFSARFKFDEETLGLGNDRK